MLGRDLYSRSIYGARVSMIVGFAVAALSMAGGIFLGLMAGFPRIVDSIVIRVLDGFMAIPSVLLAIALMALTGGSLQHVLIPLTLARTGVVSGKRVSVRV